ncbi:MAG: PCRF domain-containing protein, partial [Candidatus Cloacimonetes bacterium]|nr:PCRF domain-containing protein [Candidatus Cloacimonadota bacterium]
MNEADFWNNSQNAQTIIKESNRLKSQLAEDEKLEEIAEEIETYFLMLEEDYSELLLKEAVSAFKFVVPQIEKMEVQFLLNGKTDSNNAILTIHPGAGGTESQDWAEMLLRMYKRWAEKSGFKHEIIDIINGDEAGIK